jgi:hypothetical protein
VARQKTLLALDHHIHRRPDQHLGQDVKELVEDRVQRRQPEITPLGAGIAEQLLDRVHGGWQA